jgi:catechol 1,2-dioxygenase
MANAQTTEKEPAMAEIGDQTPSYFEEARSAEIVNERMGPGIDPRLAEVMAVIVKHLHAAVKEIEPSHDEWLQAIRFLTATGHKSTEWRQEFILLSDTLGVSMLVDAINSRRPSGATENTVLGPFYVPNAPEYPNGANICLDAKGEPLVVRGRVGDRAGTPIEGASIEVWQSNQDGFYDVQQKGIQPDGNLRGVFTADSRGCYWFRSIKPRYYPIPEDGPVGTILKALGRKPFRPAHLHFIVTAPGCDPVITHIFTPDCPYLGEDAVFGVKRSLIGDFVRVEDRQAARELGVAAPFWSVTCDFTLMPAAKDGGRTLFSA